MILILIVLTAVCAGGVFMILRRLKKKQKLSGMRKAGIIVSGVVIWLVLCTAVYLSDYYRADQTALKYLTDRGHTDVTQTEDGYFFDGPGNETLLVFYPGGKVDCAAYAPLMFALAEKGTDCFLLNVPLRIAVMDVNAAEDIRKTYSYENVYVGGHSLGGSAAAMYAKNNPEDTEGVILLAAYPTGELDDSLRFLSIYGSEDGVLSMDRYEKNRKYWPEGAEEKIIEGGNHAGFGSYGEQRGDGISSIGSEQIAETAGLITDFLHAEPERKSE